MARSVTQVLMVEELGQYWDRKEDIHVGQEVHLLLPTGQPIARTLAYRYFSARVRQGLLVTGALGGGRKWITHNFLLSHKSYKP